MGRGRHKEEFQLGILGKRVHRYMCVGDLSEHLSIEVAIFRIQNWNTDVKDLLFIKPVPFQCERG